MCVDCFFFKVTEPSPLQDSSGVRQKGDLLGPPPRSPSPKIHCCPGGLYRGSIARVRKQFRPELCPGIGVLPGPATESHIVNRGTDPSSQKWDSATLINRQILMDEGPWRGADMMIAWE